MKKILYFVAAFAAVAMFASCDKNGKEGAEEPGSKVTVAAENLVLYLPFEDGAVVTGKGVSFVEKKGTAAFTDGYIGKCYTNTSGEPATQSYLKYAVAQDNLFNELESFTFSAWIKRPATGSGAFFSLNGGVDSVWWCTLQFIFDKAYKNEETGIVDQQFNGRFESNGVAQWPNIQNPAFSVVDKWFHVVRTYDAATGIYDAYVNGVKIDNLDGEGNPKFMANAEGEPLGALNLANENMNALYIGGWASLIDGKQAEGWMTYFNGSIDEVRMYNKALSTEEIAKLYQEEALIALE